MIARVLIRHILPLIRDLIDQYLDEETTANKEEINAFYGWLVIQTKDDDEQES